MCIRDRGEIDGIIERGAALAAGGAWNRALRTNGTAGTTNSAGIDLGLIERMSEPADRTGEILQKGNVHVEADDEGLVFGAQRVLEERTSNFLFHIENAHLAAAGIDEDAEGDVYKRQEQGGQLFAVEDFSQAR